MHAWIKAVDSDKDDGKHGILQPGGKDFHIRTDEIAISNSDGSLHVNANSQRVHDQDRTTNHYFFLKLSSQELQRLLEYAMKAGIIEFPGLTQLKEARGKLDQLETARKNLDLAVSEIKSALKE